MTKSSGTKNPSKFEIPPEFELMIHSGYHEYRKHFQSLILWIDNALKELCFHERFLYAANCRLKDPGSLIDKIADRYDGDLSYFNNFDDVLEKITDIVGARLVAYEPGGILAAHSFVISCSRFHIRQIRIHKFESASIPIIDDIIENCPITPKVEINKNGYVGVHYVIEAAPADPFYGPLSQTIFPRFELQVRTLISHAWSELQHRLVYKDEGTLRPRHEQLGERFGDLALHFVAADNNLWRLARSDSQHVKMLDGPTGYPEKFEPLLAKIRACVYELDRNATSVASRRKICDGFLKENEDDVAPLVEEKRPCSIVVELAEIFAKGNRHKDAVDLYESCVDEYHADGKVFLRMAESYASLGKAGLALQRLKQLENLIETRSSPLPNDHILFMGAGVTAWQFNEKEQAAKFGIASVNSLPKDAPATELVNILSNNAYFAVELVEQRLNRKEISEEKAFNALMEVNESVRRVIETEKTIEDKSLLRASLYDNLAWYFYNLAINAPSFDIKRRYSEQASHYVAKTIDHWTSYESEHSETHETWLMHSREVDKLTERLNSKNRKTLREFDSKVFVSYAWRSDTRIVDRICTTLGKRGIKVGRDIEQINYKSSVEDFLERLGSGHAVILILSEAYFRSDSCLSELIQLSEKDDFQDRIFPVLMSDAHLSDPHWKIAQVRYWESKIAELEGALKTIEGGSLKGIQETMERYRRIRDSIDMITTIIGNMGRMTTLEHAESDFADLVDAVLDRLK